MQIVNLRHPGYDDDHNILLTLQAPDDPNGGIHHETARLACCVLANNRWDGYLSITQENPKPAVTEDGILRRKDYYFHLPAIGDGVQDDELFDKRGNKDGPYPIIPRFRDWWFPAGNLPPLWTLASDIIQAKALNPDVEPPLDEDGDPLSELACRLCGKYEVDRKWLDLWDTGERDIWDREKTKLAIYSDLCDPDKDEDEPGCGDKLLDNRNFIKLGEDCTAEEDHCDVVQAYKDAQFLFVPKFEHTGEPIISAHRFGMEEDGIVTAHDKPLLLPEKSSIELLFAHFAWAAFSQLKPFLTAEIPRAVRVVDKDGRPFLLDASPDLCKLIGPQDPSFWIGDDENNSVEAEQLPTAGSRTASQAAVQEFPPQSGSTDEEREDVDNTPSETFPKIAIPEKSEKDVAVSGETFCHSARRMLKEKAVEATTEVPESGHAHEGSTGSTGLEPETEVRIHHDAICDGCDQPIYEVRNKCMDCEDFDYCLNCITVSPDEHPDHHFLPIDDSPYVERVKTGKLVAKAVADDDSSSSNPSSEDEPEDEQMVKERIENIESFLNESSELTKPFIYGAPLSGRCIRLVTLWPGKYYDQVLAHLETVDLDTASAFEALSYCWGDSTLVHAITLSGAKMQVTRNLKVALMYLRHPENTRLIWIDAVCINQGDVEEKGRQVNLMRDIYRKARETVVWLGEEADDSSKAVAMCDRLLTTFGNDYFKRTLNTDIQQVYENTLDETIEDEGYEGEKLDLFKKGPRGPVTQDSEGITHIDIEKAATTAAREGTDYDGPFKDFFQSVVSETAAKQEEEIGEDYVQDAGEIVDGDGTASGNNGLGYTEATISESGADEDDVLEEDNVNDEVTEVSSENETPNMYRRMAFRMIRHRGKDGAPTLRKKPPTTDEISALHALFKRPWFQRIWIIQEIGQAGNAVMQCGAASIDWFILYVAFLIAGQQKSIARVGPLYLRNLAYMSATRESIHSVHKPTEQRKLELLRLLRRYRRYQATDQRDKVYALLGITTTDTKQLGFEPDYTRSLYETYRQLAIALLKSSNHLDVLSIPRGTTALAESLPFWVPDWSDTSLQPFPLAGDVASESSDVAAYSLRCFSTTGDSKRPPIVIRDGNRLCLKGYVVDLIDVLGGTMSLDEVDIDVNHFMRAVLKSDKMWDDMLEVLKRALTVFTRFPMVVEEWDTIARVNDTTIDYPTGEDNLTVYSKTIWADVDEDPTSNNSGQSSLEQFQSWRRKLHEVHKVARDLPPLDVKGPNEENMSRLCSELYPMLKRLRDLDPKNSGTNNLSIIHPLGRRLGRTAKGYLGLLPAETQTGDQVVLLEGGTTPYIVRPRGDDWALVGDAYVHGIMYGEAWIEYLCRDMVFI